MNEEPTRAWQLWGIILNYVAEGHIICFLSHRGNIKWEKCYHSISCSALYECERRTLSSSRWCNSQREGGMMIWHAREMKTSYKMNKENNKETGNPIWCRSSFCCESDSYQITYFISNYKHHLELDMSSGVFPPLSLLLLLRQWKRFSREFDMRELPASTASNRHPPSAVVVLAWLQRVIV